jgi:hypothetical protein
MPLRSGLPSAVRGAGAERFAFPSATGNASIRKLGPLADRGREAQGCYCDGTRDSSHVSLRFAMIIYQHSYIEFPVSGPM